MYNAYLNRELIEKCDYNTKRAIVIWVFENLMEHAQNKETFRYLIYNRLGLNNDAYVPLCDAGGMEIHNKLNSDLIQNVIEMVKEEKIFQLKDLLSLCDIQNCFEFSTCIHRENDISYKTCDFHTKKYR